MRVGVFEFGAKKKKGNLTCFIWPPLKSLPDLYHVMLGLGFPIAGHFNWTQELGGRAISFFGAFLDDHRGGP